MKREGSFKVVRGYIKHCFCTLFCGSTRVHKTLLLHTILHMLLLQVEPLLNHIKPPKCLEICFVSITGSCRPDCKVVRLYCPKLKYWSKSTMVCIILWFSEVKYGLYYTLVFRRPMVSIVYSFQYMSFQGWVFKSDLVYIHAEPMVLKLLGSVCRLYMLSLYILLLFYLILSYNDGYNYAVWPRSQKY